jgi:hypothetical protein
MFPQAPNFVVLLGLLTFGLPTVGLAQASDPPISGTSRALIIVGLPGDSDHEALFESTAQAWKQWLTGSLGFVSQNVQVLSGASAKAGSSEAPATRESIAREVETLRNRTTPNDRVWVFVLGHANLDDGHAFLHLPGPDLRDDEFAALFRGLAAREQVFWMTSAASGSFLSALSTPGRIVVAATERTGECNETEFPHALAEVARLAAGKVDLNKDGKISIQEIFVSTVEIVEARFASDKRAPTEHAQLDDNGDGIGTEVKPVEKSANPDGTLASKTFLPKFESTSPTNPPARSENGATRAVPPSR